MKIFISTLNILILNIFLLILNIFKFCLQHFQNFHDFEIDIKIMWISYNSHHIYDHYIFLLNFYILYFFGAHNIGKLWIFFKIPVILSHDTVLLKKTCIFFVWIVIICNTGANQESDNRPPLSTILKIGAFRKYFVGS